MISKTSTALLCVAALTIPSFLFLLYYIYAIFMEVSDFHDRQLMEISRFNVIEAVAWKNLIQQKEKREKRSTSDYEWFVVTRPPSYDQERKRHLAKTATHSYNEFVHKSNDLQRILYERQNLPIIQSSNQEKDFEVDGNSDEIADIKSPKLKSIQEEIEEDNVRKRQKRKKRKKKRLRNLLNTLTPSEISEITGTTALEGEGGAINLLNKLKEKVGEMADNSKEVLDDLDDSEEDIEDIEESHRKHGEYQRYYSSLTVCGCALPDCPGPRGEQGVAGEPGTNGLDGVSGANGEDWKLGENDIVIELGCIICPVGPPGVEGPPGIPGNRGPTGPDGEPAKETIIGPEGPRGAVGEPGMDGDDGLPGPPGVRGRDVRRYINKPGPPGKQGEDGVPGQDGQNGQDGAPGIPGVPGDPGPPGKPGIDGPPGAPGLPGNPMSMMEKCDCGGNDLYTRPFYPEYLPEQFYFQTATPASYYPETDVYQTTQNAYLESTYPTTPYTYYVKVTTSKEPEYQITNANYFPNHKLLDEKNDNSITPTVILPT